MKIALFFIVLSVWGCELFEIPRTWERSAANNGTFYARVAPENLSKFWMVFKEKEDIICLESGSHDRVRCVIKQGVTLCSGCAIFSIDYKLMNDDDQCYNAFAYSSPPSNSCGGIMFVPPEPRGVVKYNFPLGWGARKPACPLQYWAESDRLIVHRCLRQYQDGSESFIGVTFRYSNLADVKMSYGTKRRREDGSMSTEETVVDYGFASGATTHAVF